MHITKFEQATYNTQSQFMHSTVKNTVINGVAHQIIKRHDGSFENVDYEAIHCIDL